MRDKTFDHVRTEHQAVGRATVLQVVEFIAFFDPLSRERVDDT